MLMFQPVAMVGSRCFRIALATIIGGTIFGILFRLHQLMVVLVIAGVAGFFVCNYWRE